jgi:transcriptional regulator with XRE-family HTH domain
MPDAVPPSERPEANRTAKLLRERRLDLALTERQLAERVGAAEGGASRTAGTVLRWERRYDREGNPVWSTLPHTDLITASDGDGVIVAGPLAEALDLNWQKLARARRHDENDRREWKRLLRLGIVTEGVLIAALLILVVLCSIDLVSFAALHDLAKDVA